MIKKAVLISSITPFLMLFSSYSFSSVHFFSDPNSGISAGTPAETCSLIVSTIDRGINARITFPYKSSGNALCNYNMTEVSSDFSRTISHLTRFSCPDYVIGGCISDDFLDYLEVDNTALPKKTDEECSSGDSDTYHTNDQSVVNYLSSGGSVKTHSGSCSVSFGGGVLACAGEGDTFSCSVPIESVSTHEYGVYGDHITGGLAGGTESTVPTDDFNTPAYLNELPGECSDPSSCVTIGDSSYFVDWDSAPDWFSYIDSSGNIQSGTGGGGDPSDPGDDGSDNGGGSDGGSTVPDFEFDDSGVIEAIGSSGQSQRNAINALSNDVTGAISSQTDTLSSSLDDQTDDFTSAIDGQTGTLTDSLDSLGSTFTDALNGLGLGDGEGEEDGFLDTLVDKLVSTFTEDLGDGDDLFDSSGMDETLDGVAVQEEQHSDDVNALMDEIGEGSTSGIADQITSRLPSLPSGGCVPLQFGPMEISCQAFNTIKLWLTWIIYFWTVVSIVDIFFRSEQRTA